MFSIKELCKHVAKSNGFCSRGNASSINYKFTFSVACDSSFHLICTHISSFVIHYNHDLNDGDITRGLNDISIRIDGNIKLAKQSHST